MVYQSDASPHYICDTGPYLEIGPDPDGLYRITVYSGYPEDDTEPEALPEYRELYKWKSNIPGCMWIIGTVSKLLCVSDVFVFAFLYLHEAFLSLSLGRDHAVA